MPDTSKTSIVEQRSRTINSLRVNASQATSWQERLIGIIEELNRDNIALRKGYANLVARVESLEKERVAA